MLTGATSVTTSRISAAHPAFLQGANDETITDCRWRLTAEHQRTGGRVRQRQHAA